MLIKFSPLCGFVIQLLFGGRIRKILKNDSQLKRIVASTIKFNEISAH